MADDSSEHLKYLRICLEEARRSQPKPTNFCVGAVLLHRPAAGEPSILSTGYTLECPGNTHAEQCCFQKYAEKHELPEERVSEALPETGVVLYTSMEPCWMRLSGNMPCVQRIVRAKYVRKVVCGVKEPETFVGENEGRKILKEEGIEVVYVTGLEEEVLSVATAGHAKKKEDAK